MSDYTALERYLSELGDEYGLSAYEFIAAQRGREIFRFCRNVRETDLFWLYSCSKISTCTAALQLIEQGLMGLDDPVSRYLPEFARLQGTPLTVRHLMTMTGGLDYDFFRPALRRFIAGTPAERRTTREVICALGEDPLLFEPGTHYRYGMCHDVLGCIVETVSGERLSEYVKAHIFSPLGMKNTSLSPGPELLSRLAPQYCYGNDPAKPEKCLGTNIYVFGPAYDSGGAGVLSCASDYLRFLSALSMGGADENGNRILREETVRLFAEPQLSGQQLEEFRDGQGHRFDAYNYALGVKVLPKSFEKLPAGLFGWDGAAGALALAAPSEQVSLVFVTHVLNCAHIGIRLHPELVRLFFEGYYS